MIEDSHWEVSKCLNLSPLDLNAPLEWVISGGEDYFVDPQMWIQLQLSIKKPDGGNLDVTKPISIINGVNSLFKTSEVQLNSTVLPFSVNAHPWTSYLTCLLEYSGDAQKTILGPSLWARDTAGSFDNVEHGTENGNEGFKTRSTLVRKSELVSRHSQTLNGFRFTPE